MKWIDFDDAEEIEDDLNDDLDASYWSLSPDPDRAERQEIMEDMEDEDYFRMPAERLFEEQRKEPKEPEEDFLKVVSEKKDIYAISDEEASKIPLEEKRAQMEQILRQQNPSENIEEEEPEKEETREDEVDLSEYDLEGAAEQMIRTLQEEAENAADEEPQIYYDPLEFAARTDEKQESQYASFKESYLRSHILKDEEAAEDTGDMEEAEDVGNMTKTEAAQEEKPRAAEEPEESGETEAEEETKAEEPVYYDPLEFEEEVDDSQEDRFARFKKKYFKQQVLNKEAQEEAKEQAEKEAKELEELKAAEEMEQGSWLRNRIFKKLEKAEKDNSEEEPWFIEEYNRKKRAEKTKGVPQWKEELQAGDETGGKSAQAEDNTFAEKAFQATVEEEEADAGILNIEIDADDFEEDEPEKESIKEESNSEDKKPGLERKAIKKESSSADRKPGLERKAIKEESGSEDRKPEQEKKAVREESAADAEQEQEKKAVREESAADAEQEQENKAVKKESDSTDAKPESREVPGAEASKASPEEGRPRVRRIVSSGSRGASQEAVKDSSPELAQEPGLAGVLQKRTIPSRTRRDPERIREIYARQGEVDPMSLDHVSADEEDSEPELEVIQLQPQGKKIEKLQSAFEEEFTGRASARKIRELGKAVEQEKSEKKRKDAEDETVEKPVKEFLGLLIAIVIVVASTFVLVQFVGQRTEVNGSSMESTLKDGDNLIVDKISYAFGEPERFDIVVFPYKSVTEEEEIYYIKRIIGLPGERVQISNGFIYINGELLEESYGKDNELILNPGLAAQEIQLRDDEYFVLGDNRNNSSDSREIGNIKRDKIVGRAWFRIWPFSGFGLLKHQ